MPTPHRGHAAVVLNPIKVDADTLRDPVAEGERAAGFGPTVWLETTADDPGTSMARDAVAGGAEVVIAAGGDGTVRAVAEGLRGSGRALALVPAGTGNLLARTLGVPLDDPPRCILAAFSHTARPVDLATITTTAADGTATEQSFVVMAGIGIDAEMAANTDDELKSHAGWLAYVAPVVESMRGGSRIRLQYRLDGHRIRTARVHTLLVGNCGNLPGKVRLLPDAAVGDGILDVVTLRPDGPVGWAQILWTVTVENGALRLLDLARRRTGSRQLGRHLRAVDRSVHALRYERAARIEVRLRSAQSLEIDGDPAGTVTAFTITVERHGLQVRVPA